MCKHIWNTMNRYRKKKQPTALKYGVIKRTRFYTLSLLLYFPRQPAMFCLMTVQWRSILRCMCSCFGHIARPLPHSHNRRTATTFYLDDVVIVGFYFLFISFIICEPKLEYLCCFVDQFCHDFIVWVEIRNKSCVALRQLFILYDVSGVARTLSLSSTITTQRTYNLFVVYNR